MAKYDEQLQRAMFLMNYDNSLNESKQKNSGIEYHTTGADGKEYGIIKEGLKYYIKTTKPEMANLKESYDYINGFNYRNEHSYNSFNEATKQLELTLMSLNESKGIHSDVSVFDMKKNEKVLSTLTEAARKEIDRMNQIVENSYNIKAVMSDPESKGKATDPTKQGEPFEEVASAKLDKDMPFNGTVKGANEHTDVKSVESELSSLKNPNGGKELNNYSAAHDDLDGEGVADIKGKKAMKPIAMNEEVEVNLDDEQPIEDNSDDQEALQSLINGKPVEDNVETPLKDDENLVGFEELEESEDLGSLIKEIEEEWKEDDDCIEGPNEVLDGKMGTLPVQTWDKINESIDRITDMVYESLCEKDMFQKDRTIDGKKTKMKPFKKSTKQDWRNFQDDEQMYGESREYTADQLEDMVCEAVTRLNAWGKHPRFRQQPMSVPSNHEVKAGTASKDWNDASAMGSEPFARVIGKGAPFEEVVNNVTDSVVNMVKESLSKKG